MEEALKQGITQNTLDAAQRSPVYKMAMDWKLALPLHPEYRTLPMVWYVPPLSPIQSVADAGGLPKSDSILPAVESLRIPVQYLANMLSAGDTGPVLRALKRMMAMRHYKRSQTVEGVTDTRAIEEVGLSVEQVEEMYRYLAIANYEDRFVIPTQPPRNGGRRLPGKKWLWLHLRRRLPRVGPPSSTCLTAIVLMPSTSGRKTNADPENHRATAGVPDELSWENKDELFSLIDSDTPALRPFLEQHLGVALLDKQAEWCEIFERGRATSLLLFEHVHAESRGSRPGHGRADDPVRAGRFAAGLPRVA
ncbi:Respiratory nitrate reductase 2 beta chain [Kluyvera cryocrescens]|uniref:Respiratory nitrate reductase 2 beta chain n=1 Tax=Kluyvera cryocrescens TaxID=580 RepID=A0A485CTN8_KLUCR|nr:Respiratory nitrate reductase 2 beta chain [Kluyvera cryocrescens]